MVAPATGAAFLELVRRSGLVDSQRIDAYLASRAPRELPTEPKKAASLFIRDGLLTHFQASQFLQGKWRGFTFGKYKVLERLGFSANSNVYLCEHLFMNRRVAVKVLPTVKAEDPGALARFHREARAAAALDHPNIVHAYDSDQEGELHFIVMEYVDGFSLQEIIQKHGAMDVKRAVHYIRQAAEGLQHIHEIGLIHRDIKPGNLLLDRTGAVRILDLGLARFYHDHKDQLTQKYDANNILGTADYLSPEQARDSHEVDTRTDIYSLGATLYFLLTGRPPFEGKTLTQKLLAHQIREPTPLREVRKEVPAALAVVVAKMMAKDARQRYQTPAAVAEALAPWTTEAIAPPPEEEMPRLCLAAQAAGTPETPSQRVRLTVSAAAASTRQTRTASVAELDPPAGQKPRGGAGSNSSSIYILPRTRPDPRKEDGAPGPDPSAETDNSLPKTDTHQELPKPTVWYQGTAEEAPSRQQMTWALIAAGVLALVLLGAGLIGLLFR